MIKLGPNSVTQVKSKEKDGYSALQIGFGEKKSVRKPQIGHLKKAGVEKKVRWLREIRDEATMEPGTEITLGQVFHIGDAVKVTGSSKGRGFAGGIKRHGFHGGPKTHGQSDRHRAPGSIGSGTTPGRVLKGKRMAGHMGVERVSYKGLEVVGVDKEENILTVKGGVPGSIGSLVMVENVGKIRGYIPPPEEKPEEEEAETDTHEESNDSDNQSEQLPEQPITQPVQGEENANS